MKSLGGGRRLIGGEFETPGTGESNHDTLERLARGRFGTWCTSGRAALYHLLQSLKARGIERVQLPAFLCESILHAVRGSGLPFDFYPVGENLSCAPEPAKGAAVLLIHYFGWLNPVRASGDADWIEDFSMAPCTGKDAPERPWFFSLRKVGAAPLGGWCSTEVTLRSEDRAEYMCRKSMLARKAKYDYLVHAVEPVDQASESAYLVALEEVEQGFEQLNASAALPGDALQAIHALNLDDIIRVRRRNWNTLHACVGGRVEGLFTGLHDNVPLGYVIRLDPERRDAVRAALAADRIFCPVHWPLPEAVDPARYPEAAALSRGLLTLPIDQRYSDVDMNYLAERLHHHLAN